MRLDADNPLQLIPLVLNSNPDALAIIPIFSPAHPAHTLVLRSRTRTQPIPPALAAQFAQTDHANANSGNGSGPGHRVDIPTHIDVGRLLLMVPADIAANLRGPESERHPIWLFSVHRGVYDEVARQSESGIILPGTSMGTGSGRIVKP